MNLTTKSLRTLGSLSALLALGACSSWMQSLKSGITGEDTSAAAAAPKVRAPASVVETEVKAKDDAAKRKFDPFDGTGPYNEASLWNGETQDNFYFSKNILHKVGDVLIVKMEPEVNEALNLKLASVFGRSSVQQVVADEAGKAAGDAVTQKVGATVGNQNIAKAVGAAASDRTVAALDEKARYVDIDEMSVRIVELLPRNSYRIEGQRRVFVKSIPYTLKYGGVIRDEDLGPASVIASSKVVDSKMEMVK
ncbi:MAG: flagellar basal body L-ring protein FlgH [Bdellovibrionales bacterium]|nr:flagellar basal body L-ring protein FlgH [Bdellovibrionales bacterium]